MTQAQILFNSLPSLIQAGILLMVAFVAICTVLSGLAKAFKLPRVTAFFASLGQDFGKAGAVLQGHLPVNKPDQLPEVPKAP
jgi:hypothetical protein